MSSSEDSFIDKMKTSGKNVLVVYGSQTGTAEEFSTRISKECRRYGEWRGGGGGLFWGNPGGKWCESGAGGLKADFS